MGPARAAVNGNVLISAEAEVVFAVHVSPEPALWELVGAEVLEGLRPGDERPEEVRLPRAGGFVLGLDFYLGGRLAAR